MNRFSKAKKFAKRIVEKEKLTPPVDIIKLYEDRNIKIEEMKNQYGIEAYSTLNNNPKVVINTEIAYGPRKRFTLAHELGHICIPWHNGDTKCNTDNPFFEYENRRLLDTQELEANIFASELLMPTEWVKIQMLNSITCSLCNVIENMRQIAKTSVMACFYAIQNILPDKYLLYVRKSNEDFWRTFNNPNNAVTLPFWDKNQLMPFLDLICEHVETFSIAQYDVKFYELHELPDLNKILIDYKGDAKSLLTKLGNNKIIHLMPYIDILLPILGKEYVAFFYYENQLLKKYNYKDSLISLIRVESEFNSLVSQGLELDLEFEVIEEISDFKLVIIKENMLDIPQYETAEPNSLLKQIIQEVYPNEYKEKLQQINGVVSYINSKNNQVSRERLYNLIIYRFVNDSDFTEFYLHNKFGVYVMNKIDRMISMRKH